MIFFFFGPIEIVENYLIYQSKFNCYKPYNIKYHFMYIWSLRQFRLNYRQKDETHLIKLRDWEPKEGTHIVVFLW